MICVDMVGLTSDEALFFLGKTLQDGEFDLEIFGGLALKEPRGLLFLQKAAEGLDTMISLHQNWGFIVAPVACI